MALVIRISDEAKFPALLHDTVTVAIIFFKWHLNVLCVVNNTMLIPFGGHPSIAASYMPSSRDGRLHILVVSTTIVAVGITHAIRLEGSGGRRRLL